MADAAELLHCFNKGCGKKFDPTDTTEDVCKHHPGVPVFHDALKGWSCCKKRSTDFTEFLNIPGCTIGAHSNVKPKEPEQKKVEPGSIEEMIQEQSKPEIIKAPELQIRPSADEPKVRLKATVGATLKQALDKRMKELSLQTQAETANSATVQKGTSCKNSACKKEYEDDNSNLDPCVHHPGIPIFHEGLKYWSCCQRKTTDFDCFLAQEGCETGLHLWFKEVDSKQQVACRYDWHQTGSHVTVSVFSKVTVPEKTWIEANKVSVTINIVFDGGKSHFIKDIPLYGVIDPDRSSVKLLGAKVEINLKKGEPGSWSTLEQLLPPLKPGAGDNNADANDADEVESID